MKKGFLIGIAVVITTLLLMGAAQLGRGYMYSSRLDGPTTSMCVTPGDWKVHTVVFTIGVKNADYPMLIIDLDDDDLGWPHVGRANTHIDIISISTAVNSNDAFAGDIGLGFLSDVTVTNSTYHPISYMLYNAYDGINQPLVPRNYTYHPIDCRSTETFGLAATTTDFQSDVAITGPDGGGYTPENGDVVLFLDLGAGNVTMSGVIQYIISSN